MIEFVAVISAIFFVLGSVGLHLQISQMLRDIDVLKEQVRRLTPLSDIPQFILTAGNAEYKRTEIIEE